MADSSSTRILVLSRAIVGSRMSAPGIRAYHMAQVLGRRVPDATVTLGVPDYSDVQPEAQFRVVTYNRRSLVALFYRFDVIISLGFPPMSLPAWLGRTFVLDFFSNFAMEWMEVGRTQRNYRRRWTWYEAARQYINYQLTVADFIICNNDRQRDAWLGMLQSLGLITDRVYDADHSLRRLVAVAPHGVRSDPMQPDETRNAKREAQNAIRGVISGIRETDTVLLWNAGIVGWYDPVTAIRAVHAISRERGDVKLVFMGSKYPDPGFLEENPTFKAAIDTAAELGLTGKQVFFVRGWLPYEEVKGYLLDSYLGLCTYFNNAETHYSHRTRFLDLIWAELPIVCTRGDVLSDLVEQERLGIVVPEGDVAAVVRALARLLDDREFYACCRANLRAIKAHLTWDDTLAALVDFCRDPRSIAVPKRSRAVPLLRRVTGYLLWRAMSKVAR